MNKKDNISLIHILVFYLFSFGIAWLFWWPMALAHLGITETYIPLFVGQSIGAFAPLLSVLIISKISKDKEVFNGIFKSIKKTKKQIPLALFAAFVVLFIALISALISWLLGFDNSFQLFNPKMLDKFGFGLIGIIPLFFITAIIGSPLGEEIGWRGFALKNLIRKINRIPSSLVVGILWWIWHIPLFITLGVDITLLSFLLMLANSFMIDSIFLYSRHNVLTAILFHQSISVKFMFFSSYELIDIIILWVFTIILFFLLRKKTLKQKD